MATRQLTSVLECLRRAALRRGGEGLPDAELLRRFIEQRDEDAFEALLRRHGPMVLGVCRRVLRNEADAEDAFQATFLVLVRKAACIRPAGMVGNWLYGVAHRTALKARTLDRKRRAKEAQAMRGPETLETVWRQLESLLDQELQALPDKYRAPITLCHLEGRTIQEAARQLGWPQGTVATRLTRGRRLLAARLARHGLTLPGDSLVLPLSAGVAMAVVDRSLASSTLKAASQVAAGQTASAGVVSAKVVTLTEGVMKAMLMTKIKIASALLLTLLVAGSGVGVLSRGAWVEQRSSDEARTRQAVAPKEDHLKNTLMALDKSLWDAFAKGDPSLCEKLYADDFVSFSPYGRYVKKDAVQSIRRYRPREVKIRDVELLRVNKETAILTYIYDVKLLTPDGKLDGVRRDHRISHCWVQRDGGWLLVFVQDFILPGGE